jgi:hypothetical protein
LILAIKEFEMAVATDTAQPGTRDGGMEEHAY